MVSSKNNAVTLLELIIAIALLSLVALSFSSLDYFSRFHTIDSDRRVRLQNEVSFALEHMSKHLTAAIGHQADSAIAGYADNRGIRVRIDSNGNGRPDTGDTWIAYRHEGNTIRFYDAVQSDGTVPGPGGGELIASHVVVTANPGAPESLSNPYGLLIELPDANQVRITIRARWFPDQDAGAKDNFEVEMSSTVALPSVSFH